MTTCVFRGEHYSVVGTVEEWGVRYELEPLTRGAPDARIDGSYYYLYGFRDPNGGLRILRWIFGKKLSIQEAAGIAVERCIEADRRHEMARLRLQETAHDLRASIEVQKIASEL